MPVYRIFVEKRTDFAVEAAGLLADLKASLRLDGLTGLRVLNRYDVEGIDEETFRAAQPTVFSEPQVDDVFLEPPAAPEDARVFAVEYLPGQFDQRADSCAQCIALLTQRDKPAVRTARVYLLLGKLTDEQFAAVRQYLINPVETREASLEQPETLADAYEQPGKVKILKNFRALTPEQEAEFIQHFGLAMDADDLEFCRKYFAETEQRDPTVTELRMIDTYWSDHCRHTTFNTELDHVETHTPYIQKSYQRYLDLRRRLHRQKPVTLMDIATMGARALKAQGKLPALDESEEINACSVKIEADVGGKPEDWLLLFKNETHNHPTEIEPFGGAATCLGGAIRDPLSGRAYVYQAMRVTGAADPRRPLAETLKGKLPQRKITLGAAAGYSSYGNQIGLATGQVSELYHPGYVAKRLETGAVVGAAPAKNVVRERPAAGDVVILLGGRTGRDGIGGATGSSKSHTRASIAVCSAEVQKGNAPEERKIQRLFRDPAATRLIKRCNDFGAGGVSVAIGELADGLDIDLSAVPRKYEGLDGTELAISESQERMAVVVAPGDVEAFIAKADTENLEATVVAHVTDTNRLRMFWNDVCIVDISRDFLNTSGAPKHARVLVEQPDSDALFLAQPVHDIGQRWRALLGDLNVCSQKGLGNRFDSTIGASTVLLPYGGVRQLTPAQAMAAKLPVPAGDTSTCSLMAWGANPYVAEKSPYHGGVCAVVESVARMIASGGSMDRMWLSFQEFFERLRDDPARWGKPFAALLGALDAQMGLGLAAIGGKDSMSGSFEDLDVPPTIISFACGVTSAQRVLSPEFKTPGDRLLLLRPRYTRENLPDYASLRRVFKKVERLIAARKVRAAWALGYGGAAEGITKMALGNGIGVELSHGVEPATLFDQCYGAFLLEVDAKTAVVGAKVIGQLVNRPRIEVGALALPLDELGELWQKPLESVFPTRTKSTANTAARTFTCATRGASHAAARTSRPRVLIPVFPGTNCEYDAARKFTEAGAVCETFVIRNRTAAEIADSAAAFEKSIRNSQMIMIPGGFSGGDEPDGSGKFITAFFRNPRVREAVDDLLTQRDGLMLGICNGFQALIKLGLVPYGTIREMDAGCPTLTYNTIGRHQATMVRTRISSVKSPWMTYCNIGDIYTIPVSHGEGRFVAPPALMAELEKNGQLATQYADENGRPSMDIAHNPNGSLEAVEGLFSPDGRVFGKMGHSERCGKYIAKNIDGLKDQPIFRAGVDYFAL